MSTRSSSSSRPLIYVYPPIFAGLMVLWPIMAILGAQGFSPLLALCAIAAAPMVRLRDVPPLYMLIGCVFMIWVSASAFWSPASPAAMFSGSFADGTYEWEASWLRLGAITLATIAVITVLHALPEATAQTSAKVLIAIFLIHAIMIIITPPLLQRGLAVMYPDPIEAQRSGMQNVLRYANALSLALPILAGVFWPQGRLWRLAVIGTTVLVGLSFALIGGQAAIIALVLSVLAMGLVQVLPVNGFKALFAMLAAYVMLAPVFLGMIARLTSQLGVALPPSFQSRAWSWQVVSDKITERPLTGHGLEAASTWRDTYAVHPEWLAVMTARGADERAWSHYPIVPGHPHNMALEIWAETGAVGAVLAAGFLIALGWYLPSPREIKTSLRIGTAGLIGASVSIFSFSYSMWNEAFWATLVLCIGALIIIAKQLAERRR